MSEELERGLELGEGAGHRVDAGLEPGPIEGPGAEDVRTRPVERVPQTGADAEVLLHPLAEDDAIGLVDLERQRIARVDTAERDPFRYDREEAVAQRPVLPVVHPFPQDASVPLPICARGAQTVGSSPPCLVVSADRERQGDRVAREAAPAGLVEPVEPEIGDVDQLGPTACRQIDRDAGDTRAPHHPVATR